MKNKFLNDPRDELNVLIDDMQRKSTQKTIKKAMQRRRRFQIPHNLYTSKKTHNLAIKKMFYRRKKIASIFVVSDLN